ncbi:MAG: hypothetical protein DMG05_00525 [Acidobacteria bacterium]|nr:MAG: hypothetical protein DMG05_00525 [Acidobacteriota bacterium]
MLFVSIESQQGFSTTIFQSPIKIRGELSCLQEPEKIGRANLLASHHPLPHAARREPRPPIPSISGPIVCESILLLVWYWISRQEAEHEHEWK